MNSLNGLKEFAQELRDFAESVERINTLIEQLEGDKLLADKFELIYAMSELVIVYRNLPAPNSASISMQHWQLMQEHLRRVSKRWDAFIETQPKMESAF